MDIKVQNYRLEICKPGRQAKSDGLAALFESDMPFGTISVGDFINRRTWQKNAMGGVEDESWTLLRAIGVEHLVWTNDGKIVHQTLIYTEVAPDTYETRYPKKV